jgi:hypothetical protein
LPEIQWFSPRGVAVGAEHESLSVAFRVRAGFVPQRRQLAY